MPNANRWIAAIAGALFCAPVAHAEDAPPPATIQGWIAQLDSDEYAVRQQANQRLGTAGRVAIAPLQAAAVSDSPEASWRAIQALGELSSSTDSDTFDAALEALDAARDQLTGEPAARARELVLQHGDARRRLAIAEIQRLGGQVHANHDMSNAREPLQVVLDGDYRGGNAGLITLSRIGRVKELSLWNFHLDDRGLAAILKLQGVAEIQLFGTGLDEAAAKKIADATGAKVDWRKGGCLGVVSETKKAGVLVSFVQHDSAAEKAGVLNGDWIVKLADVEVDSEESLQGEIAKKAAGEKVSIVVERGKPAETITLEATLDKWKR